MACPKLECFQAYPWVAETNTRESLVLGMQGVASQTGADLKEQTLAEEIVIWTDSASFFDEGYGIDVANRVDCPVFLDCDSVD